MRPITDAIKRLDENKDVQTKFFKLANQDNTLVKYQKLKMLTTYQQNMVEINRLEHSKKRNQMMHEGVVKNI
jgi:hypothetical protein